MNPDSAPRMKIEQEPVRLSQLKSIFGKSLGSDRVPTQHPFNPRSCHTRLHPVTASAMSEPRAVATGSPPNTHSTLGPPTLARHHPTTSRRWLRHNPEP